MVRGRGLRDTLVAVAPIAAVGLALLVAAPVTAQTSSNPSHSESTPPKTAETGTADELVQVGGKWSGTVFHGSRRVRVDWVIRQTGSQLDVEVAETLIGGNAFARYRARGTATTTGITFQATTWLTRRPAGWCLPAGALSLRQDNGETVLSGRERRNTVATGCAGAQNSLRLTRR